MNTSLGRTRRGHLWALPKGHALERARSRPTHLAKTPEIVPAQGTGEATQVPSDVAESVLMSTGPRGLVADTAVTA